MPLIFISRQDTSRNESQPSFMFEKETAQNFEKSTMMFD